MSVTVTIVSTKPTILKTWFLFDATHSAHFKELLSNKTFAYTETLSDDKLTQTRVIEFADQTAADTFLNDLILAPGFSAREAYNTANGIILTKTITTA